MSIAQQAGQPISPPVPPPAPSATSLPNASGSSIIDFSDPAVYPARVDWRAWPGARIPKPADSMPVLVLLNNSELHVGRVGDFSWVTSGAAHDIAAFMVL